MQHKDHKKETTTTTMYECQTSYCGNDGENKSRKSPTKHEEMVVTMCECRREKCSEGGSMSRRRGLLLSDDVLVIVYVVWTMNAILKEEGGC